MLEANARRRRVTHPTPESLIPFAFGADDPESARHVAACDTCQVEVERLQVAATMLRGSALFERRVETPACLDELVIADLVDGRLTAEARVPVIAHLLTCARCRGVVKATHRLTAETAVATQGPGHRWRRWSVPVGLAAAAAFVLLLVPSGDDSTSGLREPTVTSTIAPVPIVPAPGASVIRVDRLIWSSVPGAERYRLRLYDREGSVLWTVETADTSVALLDSVRLRPRVPYFWRVEAQAEWMRWAASDLVSFELVGLER
jgi:hypothetical protein